MSSGHCWPSLQSSEPTLGRLSRSHAGVAVPLAGSGQSSSSPQNGAQTENSRPSCALAMQTTTPGWQVAELSSQAA